MDKYAEEGSGPEHRAPGQMPHALSCYEPPAHELGAEDEGKGGAQAQPEAQVPMVLEQHREHDEHGNATST